MSLILKRSSNQGVLIGENIYVEVHKISGKHVSLRFVAPSDVRIIRYKFPPLGSFVRKADK